MYFRFIKDFKLAIKILYFLNYSILMAIGPATRPGELQGRWRGPLPEHFEVQDHTYTAEIGNVPPTGSVPEGLLTIFWQTKHYGIVYHYSKWGGREGLYRSFMGTGVSTPIDIPLEGPKSRHPQRVGGLK